MTSSHATDATRVTTAELTWLLSLRPGACAALVATALGIPVDATVRPPESTMLENLVALGRAHERRGEVLPRGESAVVGDVLTSASALISVGTTQGLAALLAVGRDRVLIVAPAPQESIEVAALDAATSPGAAAAQLAARVGPDAEVIVAVPGGEVTEVAQGIDRSERIDGLLP